MASPVVAAAFGLVAVFAAFAFAVLVLVVVVALTLYLLDVLRGAS